ncbi:formylglycine-generating enzyme family protein [Devosia sp. A449]
MSCCSFDRGASTANELVSAFSRGNNSASERVFFPAATSFIGTDRPLILVDGEGPRRVIDLAAFSLDATAVTNARFAAFVVDVGYVTEAERFGWSPVFRGLLGDKAPPPSNSVTPWWVKVDGACWSAPEGPDSSTSGRADHPVVQISWSDARAFAAWAGGRLPTEAEWEHAARGGLDDPRFPWGDDEPGDLAIFANIWQGRFPHDNTIADGHFGTSPVKAFPANGAGLYGMVGNVWEWCSDAFQVSPSILAAGPRNSHALQNHKKVMKGGSFLCHISYCYRYRIAARSSLTADSCASNCGFRVAYDA